VRRNEREREIQNGPSPVMRHPIPTKMKTTVPNTNSGKNNAASTMTPILGLTKSSLMSIYEKYAKTVPAARLAMLPHLGLDLAFMTSSPEYRHDEPDSVAEGEQDEPMGYRQIAVLADMVISRR